MPGPWEEGAGVCISEKGLGVVWESRLPQGWLGCRGGQEGRRHPC